MVTGPEAIEDEEAGTPAMGVENGDAVLPKRDVEREGVVDGRVRGEEKEGNVEAGVDAEGAKEKEGVVAEEEAAGVENKLAVEAEVVLGAVVPKGEGVDPKRGVVEIEREGAEAPNDGAAVDPNDGVDAEAVDPKLGAAVDPKVVAGAPKLNILHEIKRKITQKYNIKTTSL